MRTYIKFAMSALLMAMLLTAMVSPAVAAPNKVFPEDLPERVLLGLNDSQLQDREIPDFGPEVFETLKNEKKVIDTRGKIPRFETEKERRNWLNKLDKNRISVQDEMLPYMYPNGSVIEYGWNYKGYFSVVFYEDITVNTSQVDEIYATIDKHAQKMGTHDVPVVFKIESFPQFVLSGYDAKYRPLIGGIQIQTQKSGSTYSATLGFAAVDNSGNKGYVTAKHFANSIGLQIWQPTVSIFNKAGTVSKMGGDHADASFIPYSNVEASIHLGDSVTAPVKGTKNPVIGWKVYMSGKTTGASTGYVEEVVNTQYPDGTIYIDQVKATYNSAGGDSGAPVYYLSGADRYIVGINAAIGGGYSYFSPISAVESELGITTLTR